MEIFLSGPGISSRENRIKKDKKGKADHKGGKMQLSKKVEGILLSRKTRFTCTAISIFLMLFMLAVAIYSGVKIYRADQALAAENDNSDVSSSAYQDKRISSELPQVLRLIVFQFDLDQENNIATWFSASLMLLCAYLAFKIQRTIDKENRLLQLCWALIVFGLLLLFVEEVFAIHELVGGSLSGEEESVEFGVFSWFEQSRWILIYLIPFTLGAGFLIIVFFLTFKKSRRAAGLSILGVLLWVNVLVLESLMASVPRYLVRTEIFLEESLELGGMLCLIFAFSHWLDKQLTNKENYRPIND